MLSLAPLKCAVLGARDPQPESCPLPPFAELLVEQARSGLVVATDVVEPTVPALMPDAGNLTKGLVAPKANVTQVATEPLVEATAVHGDAVVGSSEKIAPPPPSAGGYDVEVSTVVEALVPACSQAGGDVVEALTVDPRLPALLSLLTLTRPTCRTTTGTSSRPCWSGCWGSRRSRGSRPPGSLRPRSQPQPEQRSLPTRSPCPMQL